MRRKLIKLEAFQNIVKESATTAERELIESQHILSKALGKGPLSLSCFTESTAVFVTPEKTFVHAGYQIKEGQVVFNNIEELVIDESTRREKTRAILAEMLDAVMSDNHVKAKTCFREYMSLLQWNEAKDENPFKKKGKKEFPFKKKEDKKGGFPFKKKGEDKDEKDKFDKLEKADKDIKEAYAVACNVAEYADFVKFGPALAESVVRRDDKGNITDLIIPTNEARTNSKVKNFDWAVTNHENFQVRNKEVPALVREQAFCKAVANLKRQNGFSDMHGLEEALDHIVQNWPQVLWATQAELAGIVKESLDSMGVSNYDDETCEFMAEGILRKAQEAYTEKVEQILRLAAAPKRTSDVDPYVHFQKVVEEFYPRLDERFGLERKAFGDLYEALETIYHRSDKALKSQVAGYLNELADVLNDKVRPDVEIIEEASKWLIGLIETNLESGEWVVSNKPHLTINGDHPDMAKKASHGYTPSKDFTGKWGDSAPMISQDDMSYKGKAADTARKNSWGNVGGGDVFPDLKNPYVPKPFGDYTMKGEKGVDKDNSDHSLWSSGDTWPNLKNPYVPKEKVGTGGKGYKAKSDNLIVDK